MAIFKLCHYCIRRLSCSYTSCCWNGPYILSEITLCQGWSNRLGPVVQVSDWTSKGWEKESENCWYPVYILVSKLIINITIQNLECAERVHSSSLQPLSQHTTHIHKTEVYQTSFPRTAWLQPGSFLEVGGSKYFRMSSRTLLDR